MKEKEEEGKAGEGRRKIEGGGGMRRKCSRSTNIKMKINGFILDREKAVQLAVKNVQSLRQMNTASFAGPCPASTYCK